MFGPTGETVILMHDDQPVEIDIKTKQILREFEKVPNYLDENQGLFLFEEKGWVCSNAASSEINGIKNFRGLVIWDYTSGRIVNAIKHGVTTYGKKYYSHGRDDIPHKDYLSRFDMNKLSVIDTMEFDRGWFHGVETRYVTAEGIIPNSNKVIFGVHNKFADGPNKRATLYVLDFDTKQYAEVLIPYNNNTTSSNISYITVSENGKYFCVGMSTNLNDDTLNGTMFFNNENKYLFTESLSHINKQNPNPNIGYSFERPVFISDEYMIAIVREWNNFDNSELNSYIGLFRISDRKTIKLVKFDRWWHLSYNGTDVAITNYSGTVILLNKFALPVNDDKSINFQEQAEFINGILTFNTASVDKADINIIDYHSNTVFAIKDKYLQSGRNSIAIDFPLANGVYFAIVKTAHGDFSYKFIINR